jgi:NCAIR mutase (PurE)-related protein
MREILDAVADGVLSPVEAEAELRGYVRTAAGRFDAAREDRTGVPEAVLADGKTPREVASMTAAVGTARRGAPDSRRRPRERARDRAPGVDGVRAGAATAGPPSTDCSDRVRP